MESANIPPRDALIAVMSEGGCPLQAINEKLASVGHPIIEQAEAVALKLALPEIVSASDLIGKLPVKVKKKNAPTFGAVLGKNPITGEDFTQLNLAVVTICANISKILKTADMDAWLEYKALKEPDTAEAKRKAYKFAFDRLLVLGYVPTA